MQVSDFSDVQVGDTVLIVEIDPSGWEQQIRGVITEKTPYGEIILNGNFTTEIDEGAMRVWVLNRPLS